MKHLNINDIPANELGLPGAKDVAIRLLIGGEDKAGFVMLFLELGPGGNTPGHSHEWEEEIFVAGGSGVVKSGDYKKPLKPGDALLFAPNEEHQFISSCDEPLRLVCVIPKRG